MFEVSNNLYATEKIRNYKQRQNFQTSILLFICLEIKYQFVMVHWNASKI